MPSPRVLILRAPGTNCNDETSRAFELAGGRPEQVHVHQWLASPAMADDFQILCIPGGFSYGDDVAAGRILANQIEHHLAGALRTFHERGKLILGICNGFQALLKTGLLIPPDEHGPVATLAWNTSGRFTDQWVNLRVPRRASGEPCVFLSQIETLYLPIAHAEGKFVARDDAALAALDRAGRLALRYEGENPNGSQGDAAGVCDATGRVFGLMPHPERFVERTQHPRWTRESLPDVGDGLRVFENAVAYFM